MTDAASLPKYVIRETDRHGNDRLYFRRYKWAKRDRIRAAPGTKEFQDQYHDLMQAEPVAYGHPYDPTLTLKKLLRSARSRSTTRGMSCTVSLDELRQQAIRQKFRCAVTGVPMTPYSPGGERMEDPYRMSIDRVDAKRGYEPGNVRLVCLIANLAMNHWGEAPFREIIAKISRKRSPNSQAEPQSWPHFLSPQESAARQET